MHFIKGESPNDISIYFVTECLKILLCMMPTLKKPRFPVYTNGIWPLKLICY